MVFKSIKLDILTDDKYNQTWDFEPKAFGIVSDSQSVLFGLKVEVSFLLVAFGHVLVSVLVRVELQVADALH